MCKNDLCDTAQRVEALLAENASLRADNEALRTQLLLMADMFWLADDPEACRHDPSEFVGYGDVDQGSVFEVQQASMLPNVWCYAAFPDEHDHAEVLTFKTQEEAEEHAKKDRAAHEERMRAERAADAMAAHAEKQPAYEASRARWQKEVVEGAIAERLEAGKAAAEGQGDA